MIQEEEIEKRKAEGVVKSEDTDTKNTGKRRRRGTGKVCDLLKNSRRKGNVGYEGRWRKRNKTVRIMEEAE
jgi:hypothetical protein